ncbi:glycoside hydrolase family 97 protein [Parabacteroides sp. Marseille-P3160]|uniref:glycoside hydrolase family 97 protein n=1 Tax=Parabacteroides sp. Marseille-P3160 TaxID=1917887 RepID=UPI0009BB1170|nr:glycoside hydrolase family 97 protein [Parabacteroides sp. Marseille-P3160]
MKKNLLNLSFLLIVISTSAQKLFVLESPDKKLKADIAVGKLIEYQVSHAGATMLLKSPISLTFSDNQVFGVNPRLSGSTRKTVDQILDAPIYKKAKIKDNYNELTLEFKNDYNIVFRAYNDGFAYRFETIRKSPFIVENEQVVFNFPAESKAYIPYVKNKGNSLEDQFYNSFENIYTHDKLSEWDADRLAFSPLLVEGGNGKKVCIVEADLINYPGMYLYNGNKSNSLVGVFAPYPKEIRQGGHNMLQGEVQSRESYIAKFDRATKFPWRAIIVSENDKDLVDNDMIYKLATPNQIGDCSWIKPGKVAWDWWNDWNLYGVDFKTGINNETYKYYIDFASENGIEYIILDEGWSVNLTADLYEVVPEINLPELVAYAKERNVGLILWAGYYALNKDIEGISKHYSEMGIKGFKVDFMDRDDQLMVDFHYKAAEISAKYRILIDYHGTYKPTGLQRTFPNVINFEGVNGLEQMKWSNMDQVTYDVTIPFIRQVAGPIDYTQGAMRNATRGNYRPVESEPMSQGTRCRQLAEYIVFESPLNMMCDSPSNYLKEKECLDFISQIPTVWDQTIALNGEVGKYVTIARQKKGVWYVGALTNWDERELELDLSFLGTGEFQVEIFKDGANANKAARDYKREVISVPTSKKLKIRMAQGGGFIARIYRK